MYGCGKDCLILIPFRLPQISCFTLSLKCFSSDSDNCPYVEIRLPLQFPHLLNRKLQFFGHLIRDSLEKTLTLGKIEGGRKRG